MAEVSQSVQKLIKNYRIWHQSLQPKTGVATIQVDEVASVVASFYEKIRGVVDWKEEHLLRRAAIERILKRRLFLQKNNKELTESFILELIRGGHFPNNKIEESKIPEVKKALDKYLFIFENSPSPPKEKFKAQLYNWLLSICACEIEEVLSPPLREKALIEYMTEMMKERIELSEGIIVHRGVTEEEKKNQIYIAVQKALFKMDSPIISYHLLKKYYPDWQNLSSSQLEKIAQEIYLVWQRVEKDLNHPLSEKFYKVCERYDTPYLILGDIVSQDPFEAQKRLSQPETLENLIRKFYRERFLKLRARIRRAAIYSTISILVSKILIALTIEAGFEKWMTGEINTLTLGLNISIPPLLMFFLVLTIKPPKKENLERVIVEIMKIVYEKDKKDLYVIKSPKKRGIFLRLIISLFYILTFLFSFGLIIWGLNELGFSYLSKAIFIIFFSLIAFAGVKIRERAKELQVIEERASFFSFLIDSFSLPFLQFGKWLSGQWAKYNIIIALINALIDMPFQLFTEFLDHWRSFIKEKKEEIH